jgi:hypothetical protein
VISLTPGTGMSYSIGAGGAGGAAAGNAGAVGGDTWFSSSTTLMAKGGGAGPTIGTANVAAGGAAASGFGTTKWSGGSSTGVTGGNNGSGGGGAAGPDADGGAAGTAQPGGTAYNNTVSGGAAGTVPGSGIGAAIWRATSGIVIGPGSGGGGGTDAATGSGDGVWGGGGGGSGRSSTVRGGNGGPGFIVIEYTSIAASSGGTVFTSTRTSTSIVISNEGRSIDCISNVFSNNAQSLVALGTGKYYVEFLLDTVDINIGVGTVGSGYNPETFLGQAGSAAKDPLNGGANDLQINGNFFTSGLAAAVAGDRICCALDVTNNKIYWRVNAGAWSSSGDPAANTGGNSYTYPATTYLAAQIGVTGSSLTMFTKSTDWAYLPPSGFGEVNASFSTLYFQQTGYQIWPSAGGGGGTVYNVTVNETARPV